MKKYSMVALACLGSFALCSSAFAANELPHLSNTSTQEATTIKTLPCGDFDPKTGGLKGWTPEMGIGPAIPPQMIPKNCPAIMAWKKAHAMPPQPIAPHHGLKGWKPQYGTGPELTAQGNLYPPQQSAEPYKCSNFNPKTGALKGWIINMNMAPSIPEQLLPKNCSDLIQSYKAHSIQPESATFDGMKPYKCSDFNPKTGALKNWRPDMGVGPVIPAQLLPKNCPAIGS